VWQQKKILNVPYVSELLLPPAMPDIVLAQHGLAMRVYKTLGVVRKDVER
jgi:hypothetical protein